MVAEGIQCFHNTHMAAEVAGNKPVGPKEPGLGFYKEDTECRYLLVRSYRSTRKAEDQRR